MPRKLRRPGSSGTLVAVEYPGRWEAGCRMFTCPSLQSCMQFCLRTKHETQRFPGNALPEVAPITSPLWRAKVVATVVASVVFHRAAVVFLPFNHTTLGPNNKTRAGFKPSRSALDLNRAGFSGGGLILVSRPCLIFQSCAAGIELTIDRIGQGIVATCAGTTTPCDHTAPFGYRPPAPETIIPVARRPAMH